MSDITEKNLAYAFVETDFTPIGTTFYLDICGALFRGEVVAASPYDPENTLVRA